jgi:hypothetical protein
VLAVLVALPITEILIRMEIEQAACKVSIMVEDDRQAIHDLTRMAFLYIQRGDLDKAAELMALAEQIEKRLNRSEREEIKHQQRS